MVGKPIQGQDMNISIEVIHHSQQRYDTVGDWQFVSGLKPEEELKIRVSRLSDWRYEALVGLHELIEALLCKVANVSTEDVDSYDMAYESNRAPGDESEPGDHLEAPYYRQHCIASGVERVVAAILGVDWLAYEKELSQLSKS